jgi:hypothetical protein
MDKCHIYLIKLFRLLPHYWHVPTVVLDYTVLCQFKELFGKLKYRQSYVIFKKPLRQCPHFNMYDALNAGRQTDSPMATQDDRHRRRNS